MLPGGVETIVGIVHEEPFGPLMMFGLGGTGAELLMDRSFRALPLTDLDASELVRALRSSPLFFGYRGAPACDVPALEDLLLRVAALAEDQPWLAELDLNPVIVSASGAVTVDARVRLAPLVDVPDVRLRAPSTLIAPEPLSGSGRMALQESPSDPADLRPPVAEWRQRLDLEKERV